MSSEPEITLADRERLDRAYRALFELASSCPVPAVRAAARAALAQVHQALNGQGLAYELYSSRFTPEDGDGSRPPGR